MNSRLRCRAGIFGSLPPRKLSIIVESIVIVFALYTPDNGQTLYEIFVFRARRGSKTSGSIAGGGMGSIAQPFASCLLLGAEPVLRAIVAVFLLETAGEATVSWSWASTPLRPLHGYMNVSFCERQEGVSRKCTSFSLPAYSIPREWGPRLWK